MSYKEEVRAAIADHALGKKLDLEKTLQLLPDGFYLKNTSDSFHGFPRFAVEVVKTISFEQTAIDAVISALIALHKDKE